jgi:hypothetical protein
VVKIRPVVNIISNFYVDHVQARRKEVFCAFAQNALSFANLIVIASSKDLGVLTSLSWFNRKNVNIVVEDIAPDFNYLFALCRDKTSPSAINIIANSDIMFFEKDLQLIQENLNKGECYALSRWDMIDDIIENSILRDSIDTQDTWVFNGHPPLANCPFNPGVPGCDNSLLYVLDNTELVITNPAKSIKTYHNHINLQRNRNLFKATPPPYKYIKPTYLENQEFPFFYQDNIV